MTKTIISILIFIPLVILYAYIISFEPAISSLNIGKRSPSNSIDNIEKVNSTYQSINDLYIQYPQTSDEDVEKIITKIIKISTPLANNDDDNAQLYLGDMYYKRFLRTKVTSDILKSVYWLTKSSNLGNKDAQAYLSVVYSQGGGALKPNPQKSEYWLVNSSKQ